MSENLTTTVSKDNLMLGFFYFHLAFHFNALCSGGMLICVCAQAIGSTNSLSHRHGRAWAWSFE